MIMSAQEKQIIDSWERNADAWTSAIQNEEVESRKLVTNDAIINAVLKYEIKAALDLGCGEGWLARKLASKKIEVTGVDVIPELISNAEKAGGANFKLMSYKEISEGKLNQKYDAVICNFSLLGKESVDELISAIPDLLNNNGILFIQTLHPVIANEDSKYADGWREGTWKGFSNSFSDPAPWYFRTLESWVNLLNQNQFKIIEMREPVHPNTLKPASIIFICKKNN